MGTTLTGTTPQDTYDSLIKVTDNGPLTGSLKKLTDGLGNDSSLSLSTTAASLSGTLAVTGNATFDTNTLFVDAAANEVGIGTITPNAVLNVIGEISQADFGTATNSTFSQRSSGSIFAITTTGTTAAQGTDINFSWANGGQGPLTFTRAAGEVMRLSSDGYMRMAASTGGIQFNGDTAAANALDDYEEGTWTMGVSFGGASVGVTYGSNTGTYTKIGRQVTANGYITLTSKGSSTGSAKLTGLPFTVAAGASNFSPPSFRIDGILNIGVIQGYANQGQTSIDLEQTSTLGNAAALLNTDFSNSSTIMVSVTYFV